MKVAAVILKQFSVERYLSPSHVQQVSSVLERLNIPILSTPAVLASPKEKILLEELIEISKGFDYLVVTHEDTPFYCVKENKQLLDNVLTYHIDYGFSDNHPKGCVFEILNTQALPIFLNMQKQYKIPDSRHVFYHIVEKDINMFDLENLYSPVSLRPLRLSFYKDNQQDAQTTQHLLSLLEKKGITYNDSFYFVDLAHFILENKAALRNVPKTFEIEISSQNTDFPIYYVYEGRKNSGAFMDLESFKNIVTSIRSLTDDPVILINGVYEPSFNPELLHMLQYLANENVKTVLETSLSGFSTDDVAVIQDLSPETLTLILLIDSVDEGLYRQIRRLSKPFKTLIEESITLLMNRNNTYVQSVKMEINFEHLVDFHHFYKKYTDNVLIQKYNPYCGLLPERRKNPMQPLEKIDCWHLKRDFYITQEADVLLCKQDVLQKNGILGNLLKEDVHTLNERAQRQYEIYLEEKIELCKHCDENYTYNF